VAIRSGGNFSSDEHRGGDYLQLVCSLAPPADYLGVDSIRLDSARQPN
jgi:hypothetical protein